MQSAVTVERGYHVSFAIRLRSVVISDLRLNITAPAGRFRIGLLPSADGSFLALSQSSDTTGAFTLVTVTLTPAGTRKLGAGAVNHVEIEGLPVQQHLGTFIITGSQGNNDD